MTTELVKDVEAVGYATEKAYDLDAHLIDVMVKAGVNPARVYAFQKTGRLVTEENIKNLSVANVKEWEDAMNEYFRAHPEANS